jgi:hypothetical protein
VAFIVPRHISPMHGMLSFPHSKTAREDGAVYMLPWLLLCDRVTNLLARVLAPLPSAAPVLPDPAETSSAEVR